MGILAAIAWLIVQIVATLDRLFTGPISLANGTLLIGIGFAWFTMQMHLRMSRSSVAVASLTSVVLIIDSIVLNVVEGPYYDSATDHMSTVHKPVASSAEMWTVFGLTGLMVMLWLVDLKVVSLRSTVLLAAVMLSGACAYTMADYHQRSPIAHFISGALVIFSAGMLIIVGFVAISNWFRRSREEQVEGADDTPADGTH